MFAAERCVCPPRSLRLLVLTWLSAENCPKTVNVTASRQHSLRETDSCFYGRTIFEAQTARAMITETISRSRWRPRRAFFVLRTRTETALPTHGSGPHAAILPRV